jgi:hypothetical protein
MGVLSKGRGDLSLVLAMLEVGRDRNGMRRNGDGEGKTRKTMKIRRG